MAQSVYLGKIYRLAVDAQVGVVAECDVALLESGEESDVYAQLTLVAVL